MPSLVRVFTSQKSTLKFFKSLNSKAHSSLADSLFLFVFDFESPVLFNADKDIFRNSSLKKE